MVCFSCEWSPENEKQVIQVGWGYEVERVEVPETNEPVVIIKISETCTGAQLDSFELENNMMMHLPSISLPDHSDDCGCEHCKILFVHRNFNHHATISPFELALVLLYVHDIDKKQQKSLNILDQTLDQAKQRFVAALQVVEEMLVCDGERSRRQSKANQKKLGTQHDEPGAVQQVGQREHELTELESKEVELQKRKKELDEAQKK